MRKFLLIWAVATLSVFAGLTQAQLWQPQSYGTPTVGGGGGCAQATTFIARTSGENSSALSTLICGMVTDGLIDSNASMASTGGNPYCGSGSPFDRLFLHAMANSTDALLDICGHASATSNGTNTFTANAGLASNGTTGYLDTGFNASTAAGKWTQTSAHLATWSFTNANGSLIQAGAYDGTTITDLDIRDSGDATLRINEACCTSDYGAVADSLGHFLVTLTSGTATAYKNASAIDGTSMPTINAPVNFNVYALARNNSGTAGAFSTRTTAVTHFGSAVSSGNITKIYNDLCTYLTTVHGSC